MSPAQRPGQESMGQLAANAALELLKAVGLLFAALGRVLAFAVRDTWRWGYLAAVAIVAVAALLSNTPAQVAAIGGGLLFLVVALRSTTTRRGLRRFREQIASVTTAGLGLPADAPPRVKITRWGRPDGPVIALRGVPATFDSSRRGSFQRLVQDRVVAPGVTAWAFAWRLDRNEVAISPTTPLPAQVSLAPDRAPEGLALFLGVGRNAAGQPEEVMWDPDVADPHALIGGRTKSGKSVTLRALIAQALAGGWQVIVADPKGVDYRWTRDLAGVVHHGGDDSPLAVDAAYAEMDQRQAWMEEHAPTTVTDLLAVEGQPFRPCLVIADEVAELTSIGDKDRRAATKERLGSLARRSRFVGMVCAFATQRPDVSILPGEVRANLGTRVLTGDGDHHMRQMVLESTELAPLSAHVRGRGRVKVGGAWPREVQFAFIDPAEIIRAAGEADEPLPPRPPMTPPFTGSGTVEGLGVEEEKPRRRFRIVP